MEKNLRVRHSRWQQVPTPSSLDLKGQATNALAESDPHIHSWHQTQDDLGVPYVPQLPGKAPKPTWPSASLPVLSIRACQGWWVGDLKLESEKARSLTYPKTGKKWNQKPERSETRGQGKKSGKEMWGQVYKERELNEMRHTARRESLEGKPQVRNEEEEKKEWIGQNGEKRKERKVNVVYSGRQ